MVYRVYVLLDLLDVEPSSLLVDMPFEQPSLLVVERMGCSLPGIPADRQSGLARSEGLTP
jgi:hypothetical protein